MLLMCSAQVSTHLKSKVPETTLLQQHPNHLLVMIQGRSKSRSKEDFPLNECPNTSNLFILQDFWTDRSGYLHKDTHENYRLFDYSLTSDDQLELLFSRPIDTCDKKDYRIQVRVFLSYTKQLKPGLT